MIDLPSIDDSVMNFWPEWRSIDTRLQGAPILLRWHQTSVWKQVDLPEPVGTDRKRHYSTKPDFSTLERAWARAEEKYRSQKSIGISLGHKYPAIICTKISRSSPRFLRQFTHAQTVYTRSSFSFESDLESLYNTAVQVLIWYKHVPRWHAQLYG